MSHQHSLSEQLQWGIFSVLIVDDDPDILSGMKDILEDSGYTVETASCAAEARDLLQHKIFSVLISDYSLPDDNGINLSRKAKKLYPSLVLILITGHDPSHMLEKPNPAEMTVMRKPVEVSALLGAVEAAIQHQCDALKIIRTKPAPVKVQYKPSRPPISWPPLGPTPETGRVALPDYAQSKRISMRPLAWAAIALIGFGAGWMTRGATLSGSGIALTHSINPPSSMTVWLPPGRVTVADVKIGPVAPAPVPVVEVKEVARKEPRSHLPQLTDQDPDVRIKVAKALLKSNPHHARALKTLLAILADPHSKRHLAAIEALSTTGVSDPEVVASLTRELVSEDSSIASAAATTLGRLGKPPLPTAKEALGRQSLPSSSSAPAALSEAKVPSSNPGTGLEDLPDVDTVQAAALPANDLSTNR